MWKFVSQQDFIELASQMILLDYPKVEMTPQAIQDAVNCAMLACKEMEAKMEESLGLPHSECGAFGSPMEAYFSSDWEKDNVDSDIPF